MSTLSFWQLALLKSGCRTQFRNSLVLDLSKDLSELRRGMRKSYKALVNQGLGMWEHKIFDASNLDKGLWDEFMQLHFNAAKRKTRSEQSWQAQYEMIMQDGAVLICLFDGKNDSLIGAAFIQYTKDEGHYATAAYNRALFDKPIGHAVQWLAINYLKSRSIKHYYLGELFMPERIPIGTDRESSISFLRKVLRIRFSPLSFNLDFT